jgi:hypothetical protein
MRAIKFYDKEGIGFEIYLHYEKESIMVQIDDPNDPLNSTFLELDESDLDDIIIAITDLKNELHHLKKGDERTN